MGTESRQELFLIEEPEFGQSASTVLYGKNSIIVAYQRGHSVLRKMKLDVLQMLHIGQGTRILKKVLEGEVTEIRTGSCN